ncbi:hypothetical protein [Heyndrickxia sporothermodurans]
MSDVYKVQTSIEIVGGAARELKAILGTMEKVEQGAKGFVRTIEGGVGPLRTMVSEMKALGRAIGRFGTGQRHVGSSIALGFDAKVVLGDVKRIQEALGGVRKGNGGASRSFSGWANSLERSASAAQRLEQALAGVRSHSGGSPVRVSGGSGGGGIRQSRHGGGGHGPGTHDARGIVGTYNATGLPVGSVHYAVEALKYAGTLDQVGAIQTAQGGLDHNGRPLSQADLARQVGLNKEAAIGLSLKAPYSSAVENAKIITDLADLGKGDYAEARGLLPGFARLNAIMGIIGTPEVGAHMHQDGQMRYAARALDQMGVMGKSEAEQKRYFDAIAQGTVGTRGIFDGRQLFGAVQKSGGAATGWSADFVGGVLPMLVEQIGGTGTGDAMYMAEKHLLKGQTSNVAEADAMVRLGLQSDANRDGVKNFRAGSIAGADTLKANPFEWFDKYFLPTLAKKGITSKDEIDKAIDSIAFAKNYSKAMHEFNANHDNILANQRRFGAQGDLDKLLSNTMSGQILSLTEAIKTAATVLADPQVKGAGEALTSLAQSVVATAKMLHDSPGTAQGVFAGVAGVGGGVAAAGATALTIAAVTSLSLPALAIGSIAALSIGTFLMPWDKIYSALGWKPGVALGGKDVGQLPNELPGVKESATQAEAERDRKRAAAIQGLGNTYQNVIDAQKRLADATGHTGTMAESTRPLIDRLGDALLGLARKLIITEGVINQISFGGGTGSGGLIQKASFGGGGLGAGIGGKSGGNGIVPPGMTGSDANMLGLISKYESGGRNTMNYIGDRTHTAQGYYQITNSNWRKIAPRLGITAPNAMSASLADQARVAQVLLHNGKGIRNWSDYNPRLKGALRRGETYHAPSTSVPAAPAPKKELVAHIHTHLDGQKIAMNTSRHMFHMGNRPATGANMSDASEVYPVVG